MERTRVSSSNLEDVGYDPQTRTLEIGFLNGSVYQYLNVPQSHYTGLMSAASHGTYLDTYIKKGGYSFLKVR